MMNKVASNGVTGLLFYVILLTCIVVDQSFCQQYPQELVYQPQPQQKYIINDPKCSMPDLPVFPVDGFTHYERVTALSCSNNKELLTYTQVKDNVATLHIRQNVIGQYYRRIEDIKCCYAYVERHGTANWPDNGVKYSRCQFFNYSVMLEKDVVMVKCFQPNDTISGQYPGQLAYENVHQVIQVPPALFQRTQEMKNKIPRKPISVLFVVVDSVSRLNFMRTMPLTRRYIVDNGFVEFKGYNKIHDNTFPNFGALLTGMTQGQMYDACSPEELGGLDRCPMIWYDYRDQGYVTAYAEDWASIATFNYLKKGFKDLPTDYYFKPYMESTEHLNIRNQDTMPFCTGPEAAGQRILNLAKDFTHTFKHQPNFGIFWMNTFSHNFVNSTMNMDFDMMNFFQDLKTDGILNESIVILLSDHGIRFGDIVATSRGFIEERLPMNYISLPMWFKTAFPAETWNFYQNSLKLTSTFDLYMTLQHVLQLSGTDYAPIRSRGCYNCKSFFEAWPHERSCLDAGVPEEWCACIGHFTPITKNEYNPKQLVSDLQNIMLEISKEEKDSSSMKSTNCNNIVSLEQSITRRNDYLSEVPSRYYLVICETDIGLVYRILLREKPAWLGAGNEILNIRRKYKYV